MHIVPLDWRRGQFDMVEYIVAGPGATVPKCLSEMHPSPQKNRIRGGMDMCYTAYRVCKDGDGPWKTPTPCYLTCFRGPGLPHHGLPYSTGITVLFTLACGWVTLVGDEAARFAGSNCHRSISQKASFGQDYIEALENAVLQTDEEFKTFIMGSENIWDEANKRWRRYPGCTVTGLLIEGNEGYVVYLLHTT